jgi:hypothetical protein
VFRGLGWFLAGFVFLVGVPSAGLGYTDLATFTAEVGLYTLVGVFLSLQFLLVFTATWALHDVPGDWAATKKFFRDLPENWRRFRAGAAAVFAFLWALPGKCARGIAAAWRWVVTRPAWWRSLDAYDKRACLWTTVIFAVLSVTVYFMWPVAVFLSEMAPFWVLPRHNFPYKLLMAVLLSAFAWLFILVLLRGIVEVAEEALYRIRRRFRGKD